jgi:hypothetical protein
MRKILFILCLFFITISLSGQFTRANSFYVNLSSSTPVSNMLTNGTFDNGSNWASLGANFTIGGGLASYSGTNNDCIRQTSAQMISPVLINTAYKVTFTINNTSTPNCYIFFGSYGISVRYVSQTNYTSGTHTVNFTTPSDIEGGGFCVFAGTTGGTFTIDNIILELQ